MTKPDALTEALRQHAPWMGGEAERLMLEAAAELSRLHNALRVAEETAERCKTVCDATAAQWRADVARLQAAEKRGQRAEQLLKWALSSAEWREKRIYVCGGPPEQNWLLNVYLPIPADSDMSAEQALERALNDEEEANHGN